MHLAEVAAKLMAIAAKFVHSRQMLHPHARGSHVCFYQWRGLRTSSSAWRRPAPKWPFQRSAADAVGGGGSGDFVADQVVVRQSCRLIETYRSIPSCNRPTLLRLVRLLAV